MIFHVKVKASHISSHLEYINWNKLEKEETTFNIRLNNHIKDFKWKKSRLACKHFDAPNHNFQQHAEFNLISNI